MYFAVSIGKQQRSYVAGFLEGEASLSVRELNGGQSFSCEMALKQRDDEQDTMEWLLAMTGLGRLYRGIGLVAEGVETAGELEYLLSVTPIQTAQGYLFARPAVAEQLIDEHDEITARLQDLKALSTARV